MKAKIPILLLGLVLFIFAAAVGGKLIYFLFYVYLFCILISLFHVIVGLFFIDAEIELPKQEMVAGKEIKMGYRIDNKSILSFPVIGVENKTFYRLTGKKDGPMEICLDRKGSDQIQQTFFCKRRGVFKAGEIELYISDILGIFKFKKKIHQETYLKIYPEIRPMSYFLSGASRQSGEMKVRDPFFYDPSELYELKAYREGEALKQVHWRASAKKQALLVKHFERKGDTEIILLLDDEKAHYAQDKERKIEDKLVEAAASFCDYVLSQGVSLRLVYGQGAQRQDVKGDNVLYMPLFMDALAYFEPLSHLSFHQQIEGNGRSMTKGATCILFTPLLSKKMAIGLIEAQALGFHPIVIVAREEKNLQAENFIDTMEKENIPVYTLLPKEEIGRVMEVRDADGKK